MIKSLAHLLGVDPGLNSKNILTMQMSLPQEEIYNGPPGLPRFCRAVPTAYTVRAGGVFV